MIPPLLKLAFVQGPRDGESLEYKPGSTIRIGRIVRGNEIAIKDAGISTKHLRIVSDSDKWIIHDLGSSNGTILNSDTLDPDTPVILRHGDVIKLGEYTSIVVSLEADVQEAQEQHKLPPRPRRNNWRLAAADPDPVESVQEKPTRKGTSLKQDEHELPKRTRATRSRAVEEEAPEEKKGNSRARGGKKNTEGLGLNSIKLEIEDTSKEVQVLAMKRATRSRQVGKPCLGLENVKSEDTVLEEKDEKITCSRATRSKKKEIGGDSLLELEMVLNQARKSRAKKKKMEQKPPKSVDVEEDKENEKDVEAQKEDDGSKRVEIESRESTLEEDCAVREDGETDNLKDTIGDGRDGMSEEAKIETSDGGCDEEKAEQESSNKNVHKVEVGLGSKRVEIESRKSTLGEEELNCAVREDGETDNLQDTIHEGRDGKSEEAGIETSDGGCDEEKAEHESSNKNVVDKVEVDFGKMSFREWFRFTEVNLGKQTVEETEKIIEPMRSKSWRVHKHIAEQKQAKGKGSVS